MNCDDVIYDDLENSTMIFWCLGLCRITRPKLGTNSGVGTIVKLGGGQGHRRRHQKTTHPELLPSLVLPYCYSTVIYPLVTYPTITEGMSRGIWTFN